MIELAESEVLVLLSLSLLSLALSQSLFSFESNLLTIKTNSYGYFRISFFPQLYAFSQANGDVEGLRCESAVLQSYLSSLFSACIRVLTLTTRVLLEHQDRVSDVLGALRESVVGQLLSVCLSELYCGRWSRELISFIVNDLSELLMMWSKILKICNVEVFLACSVILD